MATSISFWYWLCLQRCLQWQEATWTFTETITIDELWNISRTFAYCFAKISRFGSYWFFDNVFQMEQSKLEMAYVDLQNALKLLHKSIWTSGKTWNKVSTECLPMTQNSSASLYERLESTNVGCYLLILDQKIIPYPYIFVSNSLNLFDTSIGPVREHRKTPSPYTDLRMKNELLLIPKQLMPATTLNYWTTC